MTKPKAIVIHGDGINCDAETSFAFEYTGFEVERQHVSDILSASQLLSVAQLLVIPGGFSFGDEIASGKILALKIKNSLQEQLHQFIDRGGLVLGICNGFQVLVQMGLLPDSNRKAKPTVSLAHNSGGKFINKWVSMQVPQDTHCFFFKGLTQIELPIRHGEGRLVVAGGDDSAEADIVRSRAVLRYDEDVNGSFDGIAGLTNDKGNVCGLMPHPEAFVRWTQHPSWTAVGAGFPRPQLGPARHQGGETPPLQRQMKNVGVLTMPPRDRIACADIPHGLAILQNAAKALN
jgi:phosphoribosylformylglycinamidine synthase